MRGRWITCGQEAFCIEFKCRPSSVGELEIIGAIVTTRAIPRNFELPAVRRHAAFPLRDVSSGA